MLPNKCHATFALQLLSLRPPFTRGLTKAHAPFVPRAAAPPRYTIYPFVVPFPDSRIVTPRSLISSSSSSSSSSALSNHGYLTTTTVMMIMMKLTAPRRERLR